MSVITAVPLIMLFSWPATGNGESARAAAHLGGEPISVAEVDREAGARLLALRSQEYTLRRQALDRLLAVRLLEGEATRRGVSPAELERVEVEAKVAVPPAEAVDAALAVAPTKAGAPPSPREAVEARLLQQARAQRRAAFVAELQAQAKVEILLEPPRVAVTADDDPSLGPVDAAVTLIAFSDFQQLVLRARGTDAGATSAALPEGIWRAVFRTSCCRCTRVPRRRPRPAGADEQASSAHARAPVRESEGAERRRSEAARSELKECGGVCDVDSGLPRRRGAGDIQVGVAAGVTGMPAFRQRPVPERRATAVAFVEAIEDESQRVAPRRPQRRRRSDRWRGRLAGRPVSRRAAAVCRGVS